jgi:hypothetical protein
VPGVAQDCNDDNPCTTEFCDSVSVQCVYVANELPCNDGKSCTTVDVWSGQACLGIPSDAACDDGNGCTSETCSPLDPNSDGNSGCVSQQALDGNGCDDGSACTAADTCQNGACTAGPAKVWNKVAVNATSWDDRLLAVVASPSGGYVAAGYSKKNGQQQGYIVHQNASGGTLTWETLVGGSGDVMAESIVATSDGGYAVAGMAQNAGVPDFWLAKLNDSGQVQWSKTYGGSGVDVARSLIQTRDGGFVLVGVTESKGNGQADVWIVRTDNQGKQLWDRATGGSLADVGISVREIAAGGLLIAGMTRSFGSGNEDAWLLRLDPNGQQIWARTFGGASNDTANGVVANSDGSAVFVGYTESSGTGGDLWLVKVDDNGNRLWARNYGGNTKEEGRDLVALADGGYALVGAKDTGAPNVLDGWFVRTDARGNQLMTVTLGGIGGDLWEAVALAEADGLILVGSKAGTTQDGWLARTDLWGRDSCAASGNCAALTATACHDNNQCTQDLCNGGAVPTHLGLPVPAVTTTILAVKMKPVPAQAIAAAVSQLPAAAAAVTATRAQPVRPAPARFALLAVC